MPFFPQGEIYGKVKFMEAGCQMFLIYLVSWFFRFDIPRISLDIPGISFPIPISLSEKPEIMFTNGLYLLFRTKNVI